MENLARAVITAMAFLELSDPMTVDEDAAVKIMEDICASLQEASPKERAALRRTLEKEKAGAKGERRKFFDSFFDAYVVVEPPDACRSAKKPTRKKRSSQGARALRRELDLGNGDPAVVRKLLAKEPQLLQADLGAGDQPLHLAALNGQTEVVQLLLSAGATVAVKNAYDQTPLHHAALNGHRKIVELLLAAGADVNVRDTQGCTPLVNAMDFGCGGNVVKLLKKHGAVR